MLDKMETGYTDDSQENSFGDLPDATQSTAIDTDNFISDDLSRGRQTSVFSGSDPKSELIPDALSLLYANLAGHTVLSKAEEEQLGRAVDTLYSEIVTVLLESKPAALSFVKLLQSLIEIPLTREMMPEKPRYYCLRQELQELIKSKAALDLFITTVTTDVRGDNGLTTAIDRAQAVQWPGPLLVAIAKRYIDLPQQLSMLDETLDEFIQLTSKAVQPTQNLLSTEQGEQLARLITDYFSIREIFVTRNLPLVFHIAKKYANRTENIVELVQEGTIGLIRAAEKYQVSMGYRFSTYAFGWIESKIRMAKININTDVPVSPEISRQMAQLAVIVEEFKALGKNCSHRELAASLGITEERVIFLLQIQRNFLSLDTAPADTVDLSLHATYPDPAPGQYEQMVGWELQNKLKELMTRVLTERETYILNERFGCLDSEPKTIRAIGEILGISRERVRQIETAAMAKLRRYLQESEDIKLFTQLIGINN